MPQPAQSTWAWTRSRASRSRLPSARRERRGSRRGWRPPSRDDQLIGAGNSRLIANLGRASAAIAVQLRCATQGLGCVDRAGEQQQKRWQVGHGPTFSIDGRQEPGRMSDPVTGSVVERVVPRASRARTSRTRRRLDRSPPRSHLGWTSCGPRRAGAKVSVHTEDEIVGGRDRAFQRH